MFSYTGLFSKFSSVDGLKVDVARLVFSKSRVKLREQTSELLSIIEKCLVNQQYVCYFEVAVYIAWKEEEPWV